MDNNDFKHDAGKLRMSLVLCQFWAAIKGVAAVLTFGAQKYPDPDTGDRGWYQPTRKDTIPRYIDALNRHMSHVYHDIERKDPARSIVDPESGQLHIDHAICNLLFLRELLYGKNLDLN